jgi:superfamily I DNA and/or RNA helicase
MRLERSIPLIYRCKTSVISGDDKQLKPSSFFSKTVEIESEDDNLDNVDSLLDKAKTSN